MQTKENILDTHFLKSLLRCRQKAEKRIAHGRVIVAASVLIGAGALVAFHRSENTKTKIEIAAVEALAVTGLLRGALRMLEGRSTKIQTEVLIDRQMTKDVYRMTNSK